MYSVLVAAVIAWLLISRFRAAGLQARTVKIPVETNAYRRNLRRLRR